MLKKMIEEVNSKKLFLEKKDRLISFCDSKGEFLIKRMSNFLIENGEQDLSFDFDKILKLKVPPRIRCFLWMLAT